MTTKTVRTVRKVLENFITSCIVYDTLFYGKAIARSKKDRDYDLSETEREIRDIIKEEGKDGK